MKIADDFLNSIIIFCLLVGFLAQLGIIPYLGHIFGNEYDYFTSSSSTIDKLAPKDAKKMMQRRFLEDKIEESSQDSSSRDFSEQQKGLDEKQFNDRNLEAAAKSLEELDRELFGDSPLSLDGLLDDAELDDDSHDEVQEYDDALDERHGVLF